MWEHLTVVFCFVLFFFYGSGIELGALRLLSSHAKQALASLGSSIHLGGGVYSRAFGVLSD